MGDMTASLIGTAVLALPAYVAMWVALHRQPAAIFRFGLALLAVGLGYLIVTGATTDIGKRTLSLVQGANVVKPAPAPPAAPAR